MLIRESELRETIRRLLKETTSISKSAEIAAQGRRAKEIEKEAMFLNRGKQSYLGERRRKQLEKQLEILKKYASIDANKPITYDLIADKVKKIRSENFDFEIKELMGDEKVLNSTSKLLERLKEELIPQLEKSIKDKAPDTFDADSLNLATGYCESINLVINTIVKSINEVTLLIDVRKYHPAFFDLGFLYQQNYAKGNPEELWGSIFVYDIRNPNVRKDPGKGTDQNFYLQINIGQDLRESEPNTENAIWVNHVPSVNQILSDPKYADLNEKTGFNIESKALEKERNKFTEILDQLFMKRNRFINLNNFFLCEKEFFLRNKLGNALIHMDAEVKGHHVYERVETYKNVLNEFFDSLAMSQLVDDELEEFVEEKDERRKKLGEKIKKLKEELEQLDENLMLPDQYAEASYYTMYLKTQHTKKKKKLPPQQVVLTDEKIIEKIEEDSTPLNKRYLKKKDYLLSKVDWWEVISEEERAKFESNELAAKEIRELYPDGITNYFDNNPLYMYLKHLANEANIRILAKGGKETKVFGKLKSTFLKQIGLKKLDKEENTQDIELLLRVIPRDLLFTYFNDLHSTNLELKSDDDVAEYFDNVKNDISKKEAELREESLAKVAKDLILKEYKLEIESKDSGYRREIQEFILSDGSVALGYSTEKDESAALEEIQVAEEKRDILRAKLYGDESDPSKPGLFSYHSIDGGDLRKLRRKIISQKNEKRRDLSNARMQFRANPLHGDRKRDEVNINIANIVMNKYNTQSINDSSPSIVENEKCVALNNKEIESIRKDFEIVKFEFGTDELKKMEKLQERIDSMEEYLSQEIKFNDPSAETIKANESAIEEVRKKYEKISKRENPRKQGNINAARYGFENLVKHFIKEMEGIEKAVLESENMRTRGGQIAKASGESEFKNYLNVFSTFDFDDETGEAKRVEKDIQDLVAMIDTYQSTKDRNLDRQVNGDIELETQATDSTNREKIAQRYRDRNKGKIYEREFFQVKGQPTLLNTFSARATITELTSFIEEYKETQKGLEKKLEEEQFIYALQKIDEVENLKDEVEDAEKIANENNEEYSSELKEKRKRLDAFLSYKDLDYTTLISKNKKYKKAIIDILKKNDPAITDDMTRWLDPGSLLNYFIANVKLNPADSESINVRNFFDIDNEDLAVLDQLQEYDLSKLKEGLEAEIKELNNVLYQLGKDKASMVLAKITGDQKAIFPDDSREVRMYKKKYNQVAFGEKTINQAMGEIKRRITLKNKKIREKQHQIALLQAQMLEELPTLSSYLTASRMITRTEEEIKKIRRYAKKDHIDNLVENCSFTDEDLEYLLSLSPGGLKNFIYERTTMIKGFNSEPETGKNEYGPIAAKNKAKDFIDDTVNFDMRSKIDSKKTHQDNPDIYSLLKVLKGYCAAKMNANQTILKKRKEVSGFLNK